MNAYIRDFTLNNLETYVLQDANEANQVLKINKDFVNFKLVHNNIRSIAKNFDEFKIFLE